MASNLSATPIFYESLAALAVCSPADAAEHYDALSEGEYHQERTLDLFLEQYVPHG